MSENMMLARLDEFDHPFNVNEDGLQCPKCKKLIIAAADVTETYVPPSICPDCWFPDEWEFPEK
jgi:hypothetical protein